MSTITNNKSNLNQQNGHHYQTNIGYKTEMKLFLIGGLSGITAKTSVAPLERLRLLGQVGTWESGNIRDTMKQIVDTEGIGGLWKGNFINCIRVFPARGILFGANDFYKHNLFMNILNLEKEAELPFYAMFISGSLAGITATMTTYPLDVARTRIAGKLNTSTASDGLVDTLKRIAKNEGLSSLYRGAGPTILGAFPYEGIKFTTYGYLKRYDPFNMKEHPYLNIVHKLSAGAIAGSAAGVVMFPNDTVRRILQMQGHDGKRVYSSAIDVWIKLYKQHGFTRFYNGLSPYLLRMVPNSAIQFGVYETLKEWVLKEEL